MNHLPSRWITISLLLTALPCLALTRYVDLNSPGPLPPFTTWTNAATTIQDAVNAAVAGDEVVVTNGVYETGGFPVASDHTNRIVVTKPIVVRSVNGPGVTIIRGEPGISLQGARCAYLGSGATLSGFTLTDGGTRYYAWWLPYSTYTGAGVYCESGSEVLTNCVISGNAADQNAGGVYGGTLWNCVVSGNYAGYHGAGAYRSTLVQCQLNSNSSWNYGGGAEQCTLTSCTISNNYAGLMGGGAYNSTLVGCSVQNNSGWWGAGVNSCTASNCTFTANSASDGGGANNSTLVNCAVVGNSASSTGGGVAGGTLINTTVTGNSSAWSGGGAHMSALENCLVYFNSAPYGSNYYEGTLNWCCTSPLPDAGTNNFTSNPLLADTFHLNAASPCGAAGQPGSGGGLDIDGEPWFSPPAVGCDQFYSGSATGALTVAIQATYTNLTTGFSSSLTAQIDGHAAASVWDFGDGTIISNRPWTTHTWSNAGDYTVVLTVYNNTAPGGVSASVTIHVQPQIHYVALAGTNPVPPYSSWATAATNIQDAVDASFVGSTVIVSNGTYAVGARVMGNSCTNRLVVPGLVAVQSLNGPAVTAIQGYQVPGTTNGDNAIRCVWLATDATLSGFTLTNGATAVSYSGEGPPADRTAGGGVYCDSLTAIVSGCVLIGNAASHFGGGASGGTLNQCLITGNWSGDAGGGASWGTRNNCTITGNAANGYAGGAYSGTLNNCIIYFNTAPNATDDGDCPLNFCCSSTAPDGSTSITNSPLFVDQAGGDLRLQTNSPCINAGNNAFVADGIDFGGNSRIEGGTVDIGAYEFQAPTSTLSYAWLQQYGLPPDGSADFTDLDGDGRNNWQEWRCDTNPTNALSALRLLSSATGTPDVVVTWESASTRTYSVERAVSLASPVSFLTVATNIPGQAGTTTYTDTSATGSGPFFYRVTAQY